MFQFFQRRWYIVVIVLLLLGLLSYLAIHILFPFAPVKSTTDNTSQFAITPHQSPTNPAKPTNTPQATITPTPTFTPRPDQLFQLSTDPYTNGGSQHRTEVEPSSFAFGTTIVDTFQAGRFIDVGSSNIGWATSTDSGITWQHGFLPGTTKLAGGPLRPYHRSFRHL